MNAPAKESLPLFCELGWHRPEKLARWNDGYYFSKCARCGNDLVRTAYGHWQVPRGYRVVWQASPPETREVIELVPERELETAAAAKDGAAEAALPIHPDAERVEAEAPPAIDATSPALEPEPEPVAQADPEHLAAAESPWGSGPAPHLEETPAGLPLAGIYSHAGPERGEEPQNGSAAQALPEPAGLEIGLIGDVPPVVEEAPVEAEPEAHEEGPAEALADAVEEPLVDRATEPEIPETPPEPEPVLAAPSDELEEEPQSADPQNELPILEVLRHASANPVPAPDVEPELSEETQSVLAGIVDEPEALVEDVPAEPEPVAEAMPPAPAEPPRSQPVRHYSDFDFMAEEEEDPIGTFWESVPETAASTRAAQPRREEPLKEELPREEPVQQEAPAIARGETQVPPNITIEAEPPPPLREEVTDAVAAESQSEEHWAPPPPREEDTVPFFRPIGAAVERDELMDAAPPGQRTNDPEFEDRIDTIEGAAVEEELPPWVNAEEAPNDRSNVTPPRRVALAALVSAAAIVAVVALAGRANESRTIVSAGGDQPPQVEKPTLASSTPAAQPLPKRNGSPAAANLPPLAPILPGREKAFVTASVLQCRSAPVERSEPVRKLVRGSEVQILGREGDWSSVAHKGRQCWAATRFLSAIQTW